MIDIEKLDNLPFREGRKAYLVRKYGNLYNLPRFDHPWRRSLDEDNYWVVTRRIIDNHIGKSFDLAFNLFCRRYPKYWQHHFLDQFRFSRTGYGYYVDEQGNIQEEKWKKAKVRPSIQSTDYKTELRHRVTGDKKKDFEPITKKGDKPSEYYHSGISHYLYGVKCVYRYEMYYNKYKYPRFRDVLDKIINIVPKQFVYRAEKHDFEFVRISGSIQYFESKQDPRFQRYHAELKKRGKGFRNKAKKEKLEKEMAFLSLTGGGFTKRERIKAERLAQKEAERKAREETKEILQRKGFRPNAFTNRINDAEIL